MGDAVIFWDFDGTLACRDGMWTGCLIETLASVRFDAAVDVAGLRRGLSTGFPWHEADRQHGCDSPDEWWANIREVILRSYALAGVSAVDAEEAAALVQDRYCDPSRWSVYPDTVAALDATRRRGWRHVIASNHVPELPQLVESLGLSGYFDAIITSARVGWEKPHPKFFEHALDVAGHPSTAWMVGDNPISDVQGAQAAGIPGILVRKPSVSGAELTLRDVVRVVGRVG